MKKLFLTLSLLLLTTLSFGANIEAIISKIKNDPALKSSVVGVSVTDNNGKTIFGWNESIKMLPASNLKIVTTGVALKYLPKDFRYKTSLAYKGKIVDSVLKGDLYIIGGGDPTFGVTDSISTSAEEAFSIWHEALKKTGIKAIKGKIIANDSFFISDDVPATWSWNNIGEYFGTAPSGLSFCGNIQKITLRSKGEGSKPEIVSLYPQNPFLVIDNRTTGTKSGISFTYLATNTSFNTQLNGKVGKGRMTIEVGNKYPALSCAIEFTAFLKAKGITGQYSFSESVMHQQAEGVTIINTISSPTLSQIVAKTNIDSNNLYAETLYRTIGKVYGSNTYKDSAKAMKAMLAKMGVEGITANDGSGLSRQNYLSASTMCNFLMKMKQESLFGDYFVSFPKPGEGTLKSFMEKVDESVKSKLHIKSGSLNGVLCYCGYIEMEEGKLWQISLMVNNFTSPGINIRNALETILLSIVDDKKEPCLQGSKTQRVVTKQKVAPKQKK